MATPTELVVIVALRAKEAARKNQVNMEVSFM